MYVLRINPQHDLRPRFEEPPLNHPTQLVRSPAARKRLRRDLITRSIYANAHSKGRQEQATPLLSFLPTGKGLITIIEKRLPKKGKAAEI